MCVCVCVCAHACVHTCALVEGLEKGLWLAPLGEVEGAGVVEHGSIHSFTT